MKTDPRYQGVPLVLPAAWRGKKGRISDDQVRTINLKQLGIDVTAVADQLNNQVLRRIATTGKS